MFSGSEDGLIKVFDIRAPGSQQEYASRGPVTSVVLHPNQAELISGKFLPLRWQESHRNFKCGPLRWAWLLDFLGFSLSYVELLQLLCFFGFRFG